MLKPRSKWGYAVPIVVISAGLLFGVSAVTAQGEDLRPGTQNLVQIVQSSNRNVERQAVDVRNLQNQVNNLTRKGTPRSTKLTQTHWQADTYSGAAGLTPVTGSVVTVTLNDSSRDPSTLPAGADLDLLVVHQQDIQTLVNALWQGEATSMMLMNQRVIATSAVRCVGNTLILQGRVYSPPFTISAMGDASKLRHALDANPGVANYRSYVELVGLGYDVITKSDQTFPAYVGALDLKYAKVKP